MNMISLIINIGFLVGLIAILLNGFVKGFWNKTRSSIALVIGIVLLLILINPLSNALANMKLGFLDASLNEAIISWLGEALNNGMEISEGSELYKLCSSLSLSMIKIIVLLGGFIIILLLFVPLTLLVLRLILGKDEHHKTLGFRFLGMGISLGQYLVCTFLLMLPVYGFSSLLLTYEKELREPLDAKEVVVVAEEIDKTIPNILNKALGKNTAVNTLGTLTKVKNEHGTINVIKEVQNIEPLVAILLENQNNVDANILQILVDNQEKIVEFVKTTNILETFMPAVIEILEANGSLENINVQELKKIDFKNDKEQLAITIEVVCEFVEETNFSLDQPMAVLSNKALPSALKSLGEALKDTSFVDLLLELLQNIINDNLDTETSDLKELMAVLDLTKIEKENLPNDLYLVGQIINSLSDLGILNEEIDFYGHPEELKILISAILDFSLVKGNEATIIDDILNIGEIKSQFSSVGIEINYKDIDWEQEKERLMSIVEGLSYAHQNIENFDLANFQTYLLDCSYHQYIEKLLKSLSKTSLIDFSFVTTFIEEALDSYGFKVSINKENLPTTGNWDEEIDSLLKVVGLGSQLEDIAGDYENKTNELGELLDAMSSSNILNPIVKDMLNKVIDSLGIMVDITNLNIKQITSWTYELRILFELKTELAENGKELTTLPAEDIELILNKATGTITEPCYVASYFVGTLINTELKEILSDETYQQLIGKHDLTQPQILKDLTSDIVEAIRLSKALEEVKDTKDITQKQVTDFCNIYSSIDASNVITSAVIKDIIKDSDIELTDDELAQVSYDVEVAFLEEVLTAIAEDASDAKINELIAKAEEETVVAIAIINKYFR